MNHILDVAQAYDTLPISRGAIFSKPLEAQTHRTISRAHWEPVYHAAPAAVTFVAEYTHQLHKSAVFQYPLARIKSVKETTPCPRYMPSYDSKV